MTKDELKDILSTKWIKEQDNVHLLLVGGEGFGRVEGPLNIMSNVCFRFWDGDLDYYCDTLEEAKNEVENQCLWMAAVFTELLGNGILVQREDAEMILRIATNSTLEDDNLTEWNHCNDALTRLVSQLQTNNDTPYTQEQIDDYNEHCNQMLGKIRLREIK
jgi:hypothetical protein